MQIAYAGIEEWHAVEKESHVLASQPTQKKSQARNQTSRTKPQCPQEDSHVAKRQKLSVAKPFQSPPAEAFLYEEEEDDSKEECEESQELTPVEISDDEKINYIYHCHLVRIGQSALRVILKAWIKSIHPGKQARHPYIHKQKTKPVWWPIDNCRHTEPDHLLSKG